MYEVKCIVCGNKFNSRVNFAKFCSKDCREIKLKEYQDKYRKQKGLKPIVRTKSVHCVVCGRYFKQSQAHQKYCSPVCRNEAIKLGYHKVKKTQKYQRFCKCCLNKFETNIFNKKFCSEECLNNSSDLFTKYKEESFDKKVCESAIHFLTRFYFKRKKLSQNPSLQEKFASFYCVVQKEVIDKNLKKLKGKNKIFN